MALDLQTPDPGDEEDNEVAVEQDSERVEPQSDDEPLQGGADETDELDEEEAPDEIDAKPEKPLSRGERRFQALANEIKEEREKRANLERELNDFRQRAQAQQPQQKEPTPDEMALWSTDQILEYRMNQRLAPVLQRQQQLEYQTLNSSDKAAYAALSATDARAKKYASEVEQTYADMVSKGQFVERAKILRYLLGDKILSGAAPARKKAELDGQRRIARAQAPSGNAKGDQEARRGKLSPAEERLKRLENITF